MKPMLIACVLIALLSACGSDDTVESLPSISPQAFGDYWYDGKAEISRYDLTQARYGEKHQGHAVMIFVTEDFLIDQQTKKEYGNDPSQKVLKLNATRNFNTGIYPYSLMTSSFTSVDHNQAQLQKVSFSAQEWCGQTYTQLNRKGFKYRGSGHSYFQAEADQEFKLDDDPLEDGIWSQLRIAPQTLPKGSIKIVPSLTFLRLKHVEIKPYKAKARLSEATDSTLSSGEIYRYSLEYQDIERKLDIFFTKSAPHQILGWREETRSGFGDNARTLVTTARRTHFMKEAYWQKNRNADRRLRTQLGLEP